MERITFLDNPVVYNPEHAFVVHLSRIAGEDDLLATLDFNLKLPKYFGYNWDALSDCLTDFNWISQYRIVLIHDELPLVDNQILKRYITVLYDAVEDWLNDQHHSFELVFPLRDKSLIDSIIAIRD